MHNLYNCSRYRQGTHTPTLRESRWKTGVWLFSYHRNGRALASTLLQNKHRWAFVPFSQHAISCKWVHVSPVPVRKGERHGVFLRGQQVGTEQGQAQGFTTQGWIHSHVLLTVTCPWLLRSFQEVVNVLGSNRKWVIGGKTWSGVSSLSASTSSSCFFLPPPLSPLFFFLSPCPTHACRSPWSKKCCSIQVPQSWCFASLWFRNTGFAQRCTGPLTSYQN